MSKATSTKSKRTILISAAEPTGRGEARARVGWCRPAKPAVRPACDALNSKSPENLAMTTDRVLPGTGSPGRGSEMAELRDPYQDLHWLTLLPLIGNDHRSG